MSQTRPALALLLVVSAIGVARAQQEIGYIEQFALAEDRRDVLQDLIPDTNDYFYYHCLHHQNQKQLAEADALLTAWRNKFGDTDLVQRMLMRQMLLSYDANPDRSIDFLRNRLNLNFSHAPPSRDRAAQLKTSLDNEQLDVENRIRGILARDAALSQIEDRTLPSLLNRKLSLKQLRALLGRLQRSDHENLVKRIAEELSLKDSKGFGWAGVHNRLTLKQLQELLKLRPNLIENSKFVRAYSARLTPRAGVSLTDRMELRSYLGRLRSWSEKLPASQNSFKALVLGNLLRLDLAAGKFDQRLFLEYLALPRSAPYYNQKLLRNRPHLSQLNFSMNPDVALPPMGNDTQLVQRYLEHFLKSAENVDAFAKYLDRDYLDRVLAETKILNGVGDKGTWYAKLSPTEQRALRERIEIRFAPHNPTHFESDDDVNLQVEVKNVDELIVRIYEINTAAYLRSNSRAINTDVDLDGLVANAQRILKFSQPAELRHIEKLEFPEMQGRGVWVVDLLGGGRRSRAMIRKGELIAVERLGDAGHVLRILDELGSPVPDAHIELGGRKYEAVDGKILIPFAEKNTTRKVLLVDGEYASQHSLTHRAESYSLRAGFLLDRQSLVAGNQAQVAIHSQLTCNGTPISIQLLEEPSLSITATDADGIQTSQSIGGLDLEDGDELVHKFLVPQRLRSLQLQLTGKIYNQSKDVHQTVSVGHSIACNQIQGSSQIGDFYLQNTQQGFRLMALGRNGEPIARLPVSVRLKDRHFRSEQTFTLATNRQGIIALGELANIERFTTSAQGINLTQFVPAQFHRSWPSAQFAREGESVRFALGKQKSGSSNFTLVEFRNNRHYAEHPDAIKMQPGLLTLEDLQAGDYILTDHEVGQTVSIRVEEGTALNKHVIGSSRVLQTGNSQPVSIRQVALKDGKLDVELENADPATRLHIIVDSFYPDSHPGNQLQLPTPPLMSRSRQPIQSYYLDSLRLDEEYSYILNRKNSKKYPGNLLPQPSLLIHPWEISTTENNRNEARGGEDMGAAAMDAPSAAAMDGARQAKQRVASTNWKSFDFLLNGGQMLANVGLKDGKVSVPLEDLSGYSSITLVAVHPGSSDSRRLALPASELELRDMRLGTAFEADEHLAQAQKVQFLPAGEKKNLGDPRTRRLETYATLGEVFQLYGTMLGNGEWEKFRFLCDWPNLEPKEQEARYNEMACHELNFFLYMKDRKFFDRVVAPQIHQKLDQQLFDQWLLGNGIDAYSELWRMQRLNAVERVLLARQQDAVHTGTMRWLNEYTEANPVSPELTRNRFGFALSRSSLDFSEKDATVVAGLSRGRASNGVDFFGMAGGGGGGLGGRRGGGAKLAENAPATARRMRQMMESKSEAEPMAEATMEGLELDKKFQSGAFYERERLQANLGRQMRSFRSLDTTKEWAETQFYRIRLSNQKSNLIAPNSFWQQYLSQDKDTFLPEKLDAPVRNLNEALLALAVIDLPFETDRPKVTVEEGELFVESETPAILFLESIEACEKAENGSLLVGQDIYLAQPNSSQKANRPVQSQPLLINTPYRANVVVTNPTNQAQRVQVLTQLPQGAIPLAGSKVTKSSPTEIGPYSTKQVQYQFYFPTPGQFEHYGAQISSDETHVAHTDSGKLRVLAEPESVDKQNWTYIADWGTSEQVLDYLQDANLQQINLGRIAFRMADKSFYESTVGMLAESGRYDASLWAYSFRHRDREGMEQLLQNRNDVLQRVGSGLDAPLVQVKPSEQMSYEHLDYKPLVVARVHQLGTSRKILNPSLYRQYNRLLDVIAHQPEINNDQRMQLCYYLILQNRIEEALTWFGSIEDSKLQTQIQYDYLNAYLDFFRGDYEHAAELASTYLEYPVPRWRDLFSQIASQVDARVAMIEGMNVERLVSQEKGGDQNQQLLTDGRMESQTAEAQKTPTLSLQTQNDDISIEYTNLQSVQVNYYQMDIELLFSRKPFVSQDQGGSPVIKPNQTQTIDLADSQGKRQIELPADLKNKNVLVEVISEGIVRSSVITANSLKVDVAEPFGQIQVLAEQGRAPVEGAYVKVYARHRDGSVKFFKDGYTDLRGRFDYATLSTSDLNTTGRFAILVLHEKLGAIVREAAPPMR